MARAPAKTLPRTSEGTRIASGTLPAPLLTEAVIAETRFSDVVLTPVKSLDTASEMVGASVSERTPVKSLAIASDTVGLSANPLSPAKSLLAASEIGGASDRDFTRPLFTIPAIAETRFSDVLRIPVKALVTLSDITDNELSEMARAPAKTLPTASEGTSLSSGNFPAPLLAESAIETTSDRDLAAPLPTTSEIVDARFSDVVLNPVKTLDAASDMMGVSDSVLNPLKALATASEGTRLSSGNFPGPLLMLSLNAETRLSDVLRTGL